MIVFEHVYKTFTGGVEAVKDLSMQVEEGETVILLGTSGSGKTTSLKMVNRLIEPTGGRILIDGKDIMEQDVIELRRRIGYAIQHIGLFPHMTIGENIAVVPRLLGWEEDDIRERVHKLISMVGLEPEEFIDRFPVQLSGGQQQRIGVARALAADPPIVLMDEPFGALDPINRELLQDEFIELESQVKKTILFVTHDVFEAVKMGDRIALMDGGELQQLATPSELVENPVNEFVDSFLGQHRFQLSLLTRTVKDLMPPESLHQNGDKGRSKKVFLRARSSLIEALDIFKKSSAKSLPVFSLGEYIGDITKKQLLNVVTQTLGETGEAE